ERSRTIESVLRSEAGSAIARRARRGSPQPARRLWTTRFYVDGRFRLTRRSSSRFLSLTRPHPPPITPHPASCLGGGGGVGDLRLPGSGVRVETQCRCGVLSGGQPVVNQRTDLADGLRECFGEPAALLLVQRGEVSADVCLRVCPQDS